MAFHDFFNVQYEERRQAESARIRQKYPDRIPVSTSHLLFKFLCNVRMCLSLKVAYWLQVIVERAERSDIPNIDKKK